MTNSNKLDLSYFNKPKATLIFTGIGLVFFKYQTFLGPTLGIWEIYSMGIGSFILKTFWDFTSASNG